MTDTRATRDWTEIELAALDAASLIRVRTARSDGSLRGAVLIGHVRVGGDEIIRSLNGVDGAWYRAAVGSRRGEIDVDGRRYRVAFLSDEGREDVVDRAYRARYGNDSGVRAMTAPAARAATLRLLPLA